MQGKIKAEAPSSRPVLHRRHRAPLLWLVLPYLGGLTIFKALPWTPPARLAGELALSATLAAIFLGTIPRPWARRGWACSVLTSMILIGWLSGVRLKPVRPGGGRPGRLQPSWAEVVIQKISPPKRHGPNPSGGGWLTASGLGQIASTGSGAPGLTGQRIYFSLLLPPNAAAPPRGATIKLSGTLRPVPAKGGPDSFNGYLRGEGVAAEMSPAWLRGTVRPPGWFPVRCEQLADQMDSALGAGFDRRPDLAAIYRAMMLGRKFGLTPAQKELFVATGTMHLFAINGLHIGIVALSLHALLSLLRCPRLIGSAGVLLVLWLDVQSTGASPSAQRAFVMAAAAEMAHALWLPINPLAALTTAAAVLLALRPQDASGASFQMSFGVVATLILLGGPLSHWLQQRYLPYPFLSVPSLRPWQRARAAAQTHLLGAAGFGAAAAAVSAVTGVEYFGRFAPAGLIANLALMPLATLVIVAGFASILCGLAHAILLSALCNSAARLLLTTIVAALQRLAGLPGASIALHYRADWIGPAALAAFLGCCLWGYAHDWRPRAGGWRPPFVVAGLALLLGTRLA